MRYMISGKNLTVTEGLKEAVYDKLGRLEKYFKPDTEMIVKLSVQKNAQKVEVTVPVKGHTLRAEQSSEDMYASLDLAADALAKQLRRHKTKLANQQYAALDFDDEFLKAVPEEETDIRIVRTKKFAMKPMDPVEACMEMELLGHSFYVFRDSVTEEVNVVYKRKDGAYGLIEPEV